MFKRIILCAFASIVLSVSMASATVDGPTAWNQVAASFNFQLYPAAPSATFEDAYYGDDFEADFAAAMRSVAQIMGGKLGTSHGDDTINFTLEDL
jgi:hypothetical protein